MADEPIRPGPKLDPFTPPSDPSPYIRTFAKDVAQLTNTVVPASPQPSAQAVDVEVAPQQTVDSVTLPEFDASPINRPDAGPKEFAQEKVTLTKEDSDGIFEGDAHTFAQPIPSVAVDHDREAILSRLRAKLSQRSSSESISAPVTPAPAVQVGPPAPPIPVPIPEPVPPPPPVPPPLPPPPPPQLETIAKPSPIHTYTSDFADRIDDRNASTFSVLAAESDSGARVATTQTSVRSRVGALVGAVLAVVAGTGLLAGTFLLISGQSGDADSLVTAFPSLVRYDERIEVTGRGLLLQQTIAAAAGEVTLPGNVVVTYLRPEVSTASSTPSTDGAALIRALELPAPAILLRNITSASTVGLVNAGGSTHPFMVLEVTSYERTFAGMLAWEPRIRADLEAWYPLYSLGEQFAVTSTSSLQTTPNNTAMPFFVDVVIANYDARALRDASGKTLMVYGYRGKNLLVIARDEAAFTAIVSRLAVSGN